MPRPVTLLSMYGDYMLAYSYSRKLQVFRLSLSNEAKPSALVEMALVWTLDVLDHIPSPLNILSMSLVCMGIEGSMCPPRVPLGPTPNAVLVNAAGKLMIFHLDSTSKGKAVAPPALLAIGVETCWAPCTWHIDPVHRQLSQAVWLGCGAEGTKVWLSLLPQENDELHMAKRVMLSLGPSVSALSVLFSDLVLVGAVSDACPVTLRSGCVLPFFTMQRQAHLYLHHILRQVWTCNDF